MIGKTFGMITVEAEVDPHVSIAGNRQRRFRCRCVCGRVWEVAGHALRRGQSDCGCQRTRAITHGQTNSPTYRVWAGIIQRCTNSRNRNYKFYGGRGIKVCDRWRLFENFLADMGERPEGLSIERDDVNGNYEPGNCRWATKVEQARNRQRTVKVGGRVTVEAAAALGISSSAISNRVRRGWKVADAMTTPRWHKTKSGHVHRGSQHPMAKLTDAVVAEIRRRLAAGDRGAALAREYGMSRSMISKIKLGQAWVS